MVTYTTRSVPSANGLAEMGIWGIVSIVLAIVGGLVLYFTFLSKNNEKKYDGFLKVLYDILNFKTLAIEALLKITYLITALFITLISLGLIGSSFIGFILLLVFGNLVVRIGYEFALLTILIYKNVKEINEKK